MALLASSLNECFRADSDHVPVARQALCDFAAEAGASPDQIENVRLATSEALTNAVLHGYRDEIGLVYVTAALVSTELWVLIADDGCGLSVRSDSPGLGLGLPLIAQASDDFTIVTRANGGTEVRMRFDLVPAPVAEQQDCGAGQPRRSSSGTGTRVSRNGRLQRWRETVQDQVRGSAASAARPA